MRLSLLELRIFLTVFIGVVMLFDWLRISLFINKLRHLLVLSLFSWMAHKAFQIIVLVPLRICLPFWVFRIVCLIKSNWWARFLDVWMWFLVDKNSFSLRILILVKQLWLAFVLTFSLDIWFVLIILRLFLKLNVWLIIIFNLIFVRN